MTTAIEYALLAGASYISTRPDVNKIPVPDGWNQVSYFPPAPSGFEAAAELLARGVMRWRIPAAAINGGKAANDETTNAWRVAA